MTHIVPASLEDAAAIAQDIRPLDAKEIGFFLGKDPAPGMDFIVQNANKAWTVFHEGHAAVIFGYNVTSLMEKVAAPFMIATEYAEAHPILFARYSKVVAQYFDGYFLMNYVIDENVVAKKWLKWLGFTLHEVQATPLGVHVRMFTKDCR